MATTTKDYKLNHDVSVSGQTLLKVGDQVRGSLVSMPGKNGGPAQNVLMLKKDGHKVIIPEAWLDEVSASAPAGSPKKKAGILVWTPPVLGLGIGLAIAKYRNGTARDYFGWGFLGLMLGSIPTILFYRSNMERMASAAARVYGKKNADKRSRSSALVESISLMNKTQNGTDLDSGSKTNLQALIDQKNFNQDEYKILKQYITLSNAVSIYGEDVSALSKEDQDKVKQQRAKIQELESKINSNQKMSAFVAEIFGGESEAEPESTEQ